MSSPPRLTMRMKVDLHGLVPDPHEFDPSIAHHTTFGTGRYPSKIPLTPEQAFGKSEITLSPYTLPPLSELRGDEQVMFHVTPCTRFTGMPEMDATEGKFVTRDKLSGFFALPLSHLIRSAQRKEPISMPIEDKYLYDSLIYESGEPSAAGVANAHYGATKGTLKSLHVTVTPPEAMTQYASRLEKLMSESERDVTRPLLYGTKRFAAAQELAEEIIGHYYGTAFANRNARFPNALDRICSVLHMPYFTANMGNTLPLTFFASRDHPRLEPPKANYVGNALYDVSDKTLAFYEKAARSSFASVGLSPEGALRFLKQQWQSKRSDALEPLTPRLIDGSVRTLQAFGNSLKYRSDDRTPNRQWLESNGAQSAASYKSYKSAPLLRNRRLLAKYGAGGGDEIESEIERANESMDDLSHSGILNANDCEDMTKPPLAVATEIVPLDPRLSLDPRRLERYPLLQATAHILQRYDLMGTGGAAKSPYLDTSKETVEVKNNYNGHIHGIGHSRILMDDMVDRGGFGSLKQKTPSYFDKLDLDGKVTREIAPFEALLPSFLMEGTSPGATFIQPPEELGLHWAAGVAASRKVYSSVLRLGAPSNAPKSYESVMSSVFSPRELPRSKGADGNEKMSLFYHAPIHVVSERLAALDPRLSHFNYVNTQTRARGVPIEEVLRTRPHDKTSPIALVSPFTEASEEELKSVFDVAAVIKNTQPAPAMTRFTEVDRATHPHNLVPDHNSALLRLGHPLSDASFAAMSRFKLPEHPPRAAWNALTRALDNHSFGLQKREATFGGASGDATVPAGIDKLTPHLDREDRTVYSLFAPAWAVANADMKRLDGEIKELYDKGLIIDHAMWRDRFLQHCDDQITLALVVPITKQ